MMPYLIVVDDEDDLREPVAAYLSDQGMHVDEAGGGRALDALVSRRVPDLVVLDVTMPEEDGFSIAKRLRAAHPRMGILMLTARKDVVDRVVGLEVGADDYLMKPFEPRELLARVRAVLRRLRTEVSAVRPEAPAEDASAPALPRVTNYSREFWIPANGGTIRLGVEQIEWIEAAKDYALLHTGERSHMIRMTMSALEEALDPADMMRVHRSSFVRPDAVLQISALGRHMALVLRSGRAVRVGPRHWTQVRERLSG